MSTTTKNLDITLRLTERDDPTDTITRRMSIPCNPDTSPATMVTNIKRMNNAMGPNSTEVAGLIQTANAIKVTFQEIQKEGGDTYIYTPSSIIKAEIVNVTEDVIYGN